MGIVKTASESILEETVLPSEEANYSLQGHTVEFDRSVRKSINERRSPSKRIILSSNGQEYLNRNDRFSWYLEYACGYEQWGGGTW
ncbi:synaptotagmin-10-like isoform X1, partial [Vespula squamosa]